MAQTHVLTSERPEKLQKDKAEKCSDLELHFEWILAPFWVHEQMVVHKSECEKGAPKR